MPGRKLYGVLMGDLVGSSSAADREALHRTFNRAIANANERYADEIVSPLTITLGDEFQGLTVTLTGAFRVNRFVRLSLLLEGVKSRFVVGTANIDTDVNRERAWNMMGKGLAEARAKLSDKKDENCYRFSFPDSESLELALDGVGSSLTRIEADWTETQLRYVAEVMSHPEKSRSEVARDLEISDNSLYKVLRSGEFRFYIQQIETLQAVMKLEDRRRGTILEAGS